MPLGPYCVSRFETVRRRSRRVMVGGVGVGGDEPLRVQSMTTTPTQDVAATVAQSIALAEAGCEIVRITAPNVKAAEALREIRRDFTAAGFGEVPLVADIHFLPAAAMEAVKWVEKVRINPGNYADKKKFAQKIYTDAEYREELERLHEAFSPIVRECKRLGRAMRIGTNHGSLSDRIMNRYGDTPLGMCESALEFLRIAESEGFREVVLSMKASNPKVMIAAYRLMVAKMAAEGMHYPLHLGVTEAGDGDDARIKSAIGIGSLLYDGLGDTIRVSLTEDPVYEIPVARDLAAKAEALWREAASRTEPDPIDPYAYRRREVVEVVLGDAAGVGVMQPPRVIQPYPLPASNGDMAAWARGLGELQAGQKEAKIEGLLLKAEAGTGVDLGAVREAVRPHVSAVVWEGGGWASEAVMRAARPGDVAVVRPRDGAELAVVARATVGRGLLLAVDATPLELVGMGDALAGVAEGRLIFTLTQAGAGVGVHPLGAYRQLAEVLAALGRRDPIWIRHTGGTSIAARGYFGDSLMEASLLIGALLAEGIGDLVSVETVPDVRQSVTLAYDILQGARSRTTKTEFVACPSCGRTLFDLQTTTQRIRAATGHLKGVTIAVMGCIVNGPGEMADADFGYVGGAPGKVNLYVGRDCVRYHVPAEEAVEALIALIRDHGKWREPERSA